MCTDSDSILPCWFRPLTAVLPAVVLSTCVAALADAPPSFARDIQPILARRCFVCHGPAEHESGLALHLSQSATARAESGRIAIVPGHPNESELLRRILATDPKTRMPPDGPPLEKHAVEKLRSWIAAGADYSSHWAWSRPKPARIPTVRTASWPANPIDNFILARLEQQGIVPSLPADPLTLLRRVHLDLIGLPPSPEDVAIFANQLSGSTDITRFTNGSAEVDNDRFERVYQNVVDRLLASPHFGERWGRHWLDLARYADSFGYERDDVRPNAWRYRDWVIGAVNRDLPFADFAIQQLAGDLLPDRSTETLLAAGLHRMNIKNNESGINKEDYRNREIVDRVNTTATAFIGITIGCCQCHDHKYDPFAQSDFYRFYALFNNAVSEDVDIPGTPAEQAAYQEALQNVQRHERELKQLELLLQAVLKAGGIDEFLNAKRPDTEVAQAMKTLGCNSALQSAILTSVDQRTTAESQEVMTFNTSLSARLDDNNKALRQLSVEKRHLPKPYIMTLKELQENRRKTHIFIRGDFKQAGPLVTPGIPGILGTIQPREAQPQLDRLDLARWIVSPDNILARRVAVNRIWQHLFGTALVSTVDDFGMQGSPPSHPKLLEWLAQEFLRSGGSRKALIRMIVLSHTYRQASHHRQELESTDPENQWLARQNRFRVESELVRDLALAASGLIYQKLGGPTIHPPVSSAIRDLAYKYKTRWIVSEPPERYSRGIYVHFKRTNPFPSLIMFDSPESNVCMAVRNRSNTPLQALTTLNDPVFVEAAQAFARRILNRAANEKSRLQLAGLIALGRPLSRPERGALERLRSAELSFFQKHMQAAIALVGDQPCPDTSTAELASWISVTRTLINLDEFITRE